MSAEDKVNSEFIASVYGKPVIIGLFTGVIYKGILGSLDGFLNVVLEQAEEYNDGKFVARFNDCFLRGNNIMYIAPNDEI
ncbi:uncharacterized protein [Blastocystis hominis]|uniref:Sm domain-containing protein n=1 Tax=Blastocystis hominis TaxID=12968 RepID=D8M969_BLAHO|nr:uncharacterized protein [Blastocystis hominis]CBK24608.2 unnamed protein product [Blastocystis hominis]|eukprot:XP_012898656.1 uncharacterized protein [Blastocystis hominis]